MVDVASWSELREEDLKRENRELRADAERASEELDRLRAEVASLKEQNALLVAQGQRVYAAADAVVKRWDTPLWKDVRPTAELIYALRDALTALPQQVKSEDARMLEFVYSENYTSSNALVEIELRMLNGDFPTMEEVRKAIRAAISAQENKS